MAFLKNAYRKISSMRTGLLLMALFALAASIGSTVMPDMFFRTILFKSLLALITLSMLSCTLNRLIRFKPRLLMFSKHPHKSGSVKQIGILLLHIGIILIITGATVYLVSGQSVTLKLAEGETADISKLIPVGRPFSMRLNQFQIEYNDDGSPSQYYSQVQITEEDGTKQNNSISVNHPLKYAGIKAYQESYGNRVRIRVTDPAQKDTENSLNEGESLPIPGTELAVKIYRYIPNFDPAYGMNSKTLRPDKPRVVFSVYEKDKLLGVGTAQIRENIELNNGIKIFINGIDPYTVLKLKSDPGLPVTTAGGGLLMLGVLMAFLSFRQSPKATRDQVNSEQKDSGQEFKEIQEDQVVEDGILPGLAADKY
jgi:ResB protein required for cytochrome c biosynthesis